MTDEQRKLITHLLAENDFVVLHLCTECDNILFVPIETMDDFVARFMDAAVVSRHLCENHKH